MIKNRVFNNVKKLLQKKKLPIQRKSIVRDTEHLIFTGPVVVLIDKNDEVNLAFHVASNPEFSARLTLEMQKLEGVKKVNIGEVFIMKNETEMITGDDAIKELNRQTYDGIIKSFIKEQMENELLNHGPAKNC